MSFDVIVIGAGHNGLTAAGLLAKAGRRVLVVERRDQTGGVAAGSEFAPGFRTQGLLCDSTGVRRGVARALGLERQGLRFLAEEPPVLVCSQQGPGLLLHRDPDKARAELDRVSPRDARRYAEFRAFLARLRPLARRALDARPPGVIPDAAGLLQLLRAGVALRGLGGMTMLEVLRVAPMCVADWLNEWFESEILKCALATPALHGGFAGPWSAGTVASFLLNDCSASAPVLGGPAALVRALEAAAKGFGAELRLSSAVKGIRVRQGRVAGVLLEDGRELSAAVVLSCCDPKRTFLGLLAARDLPLDLERQIRVFRMRGTTAKVNLALKAPLDFSSRPGQVLSAVRTGERIDDLERAFDAVKYRRFSERPLLEIRAPTVDDPSLAPPGRHVAEILVHFVPYDLDGGWNPGRREALGDAVTAELALHAPGARGSILARQVLTPADLEQLYGLTGGHIHHGEHGLDQLYALRPSADTARYATPIKGLFLGGSGSHPGGGITCAPGALAAEAILRR